MLTYSLKLNYHYKQLTGDNWDDAVHNAVSCHQFPSTIEAYLSSGRNTAVVVLPFHSTANVITQVDKSSSGDEIPEHDPKYHLLCLFIYHWTTTHLYFQNIFLSRPNAYLIEVGLRKASCASCIIHFPCY